MFNSASMFSYAASGSLNEKSMANYVDYVNTQNQATLSSGVSCWLKKQAEIVDSHFNDFVNSKVWELGKRLLGKDKGDYVSPFDIGYLGSLEGLQNAEGLMRNYIMANPTIQQMYLDELISGYEGKFSDICKGVGEENLFYRNAMNGVLNLQTLTEEDKTSEVMKQTHYYDTLNDELSFRERVNIHRTWNATAVHLAKDGLFDITSSKGEKRKEKKSEK